MFRVELKSSQSEAPPDEIEIFCDRQALAVVQSQLRRLIEGKTDHLHLMSASWGGNDLDDGPSPSGNSIIHHMKINVSDS